MKLASNHTRVLKRRAADSTLRRLEIALPVLLLSFFALSAPARAQNGVDAAKSGEAITSAAGTLDRILTPGSPTAVEASPTSARSGFELYQNYPNPFGEDPMSGSPVTTIRYSLSRQMHVTLTVYDLAGRRIAVLADDVLVPGTYETAFYPEDLPSGVYLYSLSAGNAVQTRRMIFTK